MAGFLLGANGSQIAHGPQNGPQEISQGSQHDPGRNLTILTRNKKATRNSSGPHGPQRRAANYRDRLNPDQQTSIIQIKQRGSHRAFFHRNIEIDPHVLSFVGKPGLHQPSNDVALGLAEMRPARNQKNHVFCIRRPLAQRVWGVFVNINRLGNCGINRGIR